MMVTDNSKFPDLTFSFEWLLNNNNKDNDNDNDNNNKKKKITGEESTDLTTVLNINNKKG